MTKTEINEAIEALRFKAFCAEMCDDQVVRRRELDEINPQLAALYEALKTATE